MLKFVKPLLFAAAAGLIGLFAARGADERSAAPAAVLDHAEITRLWREDQRDRKPDEIDWNVVGPRDRAREARVKELYAADALITANDYYRAALILQHARTPEDFLLCHELCMVAMSLGSRSARSLAACSEDRFLMSIGRPQRFGTQFVNSADGQMSRYQMDDGVTDTVRKALDIPAVAPAAKTAPDATR